MSDVIAKVQSIIKQIEYKIWNKNIFNGHNLSGETIKGLFNKYNKKEVK